MSEEVFQSGKWTGFYLYSHRLGGRRRMDLVMSFANGLVRGSGSDDVGIFTIRGKFDAKAKEAWWEKTYVGRHSVHYRGYRDAICKAIWGIWEIGDGAKGGFKIWPVGSGADDEVETAIKPEPKPKEAKLSFVVYKRVDTPPVVKSNDRLPERLN